MTGRELVIRTLRHEKLERAPWVPFAGIHAGKLKGYDAREVLSDVDKLVDSLLEVNRVYRPDGQPVVFDLQLEAEALGCELLWADKAPPSVSSHPLAHTRDIPTRIPGPGEARLGMAIEAMHRMKKAVGKETALYGLVAGPFTLASHLRGTEIFMDMILDPPYVHALFKYAFEGTVVATAAYFIPNRNLVPEEILIIALIAAATFAVLDLFAPSIGSSVRTGAGFGIGANLVGFPGGQPVVR